MDWHRYCSDVGVDRPYPLFSIAGVQLGMRVGLSVEMAESRSKLGTNASVACQDNAMVQPLTFIGELYVSVSPVPQIGGSLAMRGVLYEFLGIDFLHISNLALGLAFTPPSPIPTRIQAEGTLSLGRQCYTRTETGEVIDIGKLTGACTRATVAFQYDAGNPRGNYFLASILGFDLQTLIKVFAPNRTANALVDILPQPILDTGFVGPASFSYSAALGDTYTFTGTKIPAG